MSKLIKAIEEALKRHPTVKPMFRRLKFKETTDIYGNPALLMYNLSLAKAKNLKRPDVSDLVAFEKGLERKFPGLSVGASLREGLILITSTDRQYMEEAYRFLRENPEYTPLKSQIQSAEYEHLFLSRITQHQ